MFHSLIESRLRAVVSALVPAADPATIQVKPASEARFGDFQSNSLMLVAKAARLGLDRLPEKVLPPPQALPCVESVMTSRHLDEALVCILAALPLTAPIPDDRLVTTLRWLRSALQLRTS